MFKIEFSFHLHYYSFMAVWRMSYTLSWNNPVSTPNIISEYLANDIHSCLSLMHAFISEPIWNQSFGELAWWVFFLSEVQTVRSCWCRVVSNIIYMYTCNIVSVSPTLQEHELFFWNTCLAFSFALWDLNSLLMLKT